MRVLFVSPSGTLAGGAQRSLIELLEALVADGRLDLTLAVPELGPLSERAGAVGIPVVLAPRAPWLSSFFDGASPKTLARRVRFATRIARCSSSFRRVIRERRPDVVVTNTIDSPVAALAARWGNTPHVWWVREFGLADSGKRFLIGERASFAVVGRTSRFVVAISAAVAEHLTGFLDPDRVVVIRPAISLEAGPPLRAPGEGEPLRLLLLGRVIRTKGHVLALDALHLVKERAVDVHLRVVGVSDPEFQEQLEQHRAVLGLDDVVEFAPWSEPRAELDRAHVVLMCSDQEAFGRVTAEALERGRPVIGARSGGTPEMVHDRVNGLLFLPGSPRSLADAIAEVARDPALLEQLAAGARQRGSGWSSTSDAVDAVVDCVARAARSGGATSSSAGSSSS